MERYQELIDSCIYPELGAFSEAAKKAQSVEELQMALNNTPAPALNMLNTKYIIFNPSYPPLINPNALGNAWFVEKPVLHYKYSAREEKLVVFSEIYYPAGWKCYIDGKESQYFRTDWVLRGMVVPTGDHEIKFAFKPASYYVGNKISLASSVLLILLFAGYFFTKFKMKSKPE